VPHSLLRDTRLIVRAQRCTKKRAGSVVPLEESARVCLLLHDGLATQAFTVTRVPRARRARLASFSPRQPVPIPARSAPPGSIQNLGRLRAETVPRGRTGTEHKVPLALSV
jgi:hypothetical protein